MQQFSQNWGIITDPFRSFLHISLTNSRIDDLKKMLTPLLSKKKLSVQVVGTSEPGEKKKEEPSEKSKETKLKFYSGENFVSDPSVWRKSLKMNPLVFITE